MHGKKPAPESILNRVAGKPFQKMFDILGHNNLECGIP